MFLTCPQCGKVYALDSQRLASEGRAFVRCNACLQVIALDDPNILHQAPADLPGRPDGGSVQESPILQDLRRNFKRLYPMPHVMLKTRSLLADPEVDLKAVGAVINTDPALASRVLKVTNSAFFGLNRKVTSISHAVSLLGLKTVAQIIAIVSNSKMLKGPLHAYGMHSGQLWRHSLSAAVAAENLASRALRGGSDEAFLAGLLHDVGKILLHPSLVKNWTSFQQHLQAAGGVSLQAEQKLLGLDHAVAGSELCKGWDLSEAIVEAVKGHHAPLAETAGSLAGVISLADAVAHGLNTSPNDAPFQDIGHAAQTHFGLSQSELDRCLGQIAQTVETLEEDTY